MAHYLIVHESGEIATVVAKNIKEVARSALGGDGESATIYRLAGPGRRVRARVEKQLVFDVAEDPPGEDT